MRERQSRESYSEKPHRHSPIRYSGACLSVRCKGCRPPLKGRIRGTANQAAKKISSETSRPPRPRRPCTTAEISDFSPVCLGKERRDGTQTAGSLLLTGLIGPSKLLSSSILALLTV
jgi:hypothetical protein